MLNIRMQLFLGLLIEPNKKSFRNLLNKNRNAIHINTCLSNSKKPQKVKFINPHYDQLGGVAGKLELCLNLCILLQRFHY